MTFKVDVSSHKSVLMCTVGLIGGLMGMMDGMMGGMMGLMMGLLMCGSTHTSLLADPIACFLL